MKTLVTLLTYARPNLTELWLSAYENADKPEGTKLLVVQNYDHQPNKEIVKLIKDSSCVDCYWPRFNEGVDIAPLKEVVSGKYKEHFNVKDTKGLSYFDEDFDALLWVLDDNLPMRKDFITAFTEPYETNNHVGLIGNYWVKNDFYTRYFMPIPDHIRTTCFSLRFDVAKRLVFPNPIVTKWDCYMFEWADKKLNMTQQVIDMGLGVWQVDKDYTSPWAETNKYFWDVGSLNIDNPDKRCKKVLWKEYWKQFADNAVTV